MRSSGIACVAVLGEVVIKQSAWLKANQGRCQPFWILALLLDFGLFPFDFFLQRIA